MDLQAIDRLAAGSQRVWSALARRAVIALGGGMLGIWALPACTQPAKPLLGPVELPYFGLVMNRASGKPPWPTVPFGSWRLWDTYVTWPLLEREPGRWDFTALDNMVADAAEHKVNVLMPLAHSPKWASARPDEPGAYAPGSVAEPARIEDWRNYIRTVGTRYKGRIVEYQVWNEPSDRTHFSGTVEKLVELTCEASRILKSIDPTIRIVSAGSAGGGGHIRYLDRFLAAGGASCIDVVAHHFYVPRLAPEAMVPLIREVKSVMHKNGVGHLPLWNTETGWWITNTDGVPDAASMTKGGWRKLDADQELGAVIQRVFLLSRAEGVERVYWYSWANTIFGLADASGKPKPAMRYWNDIANRMLGSTGVTCALAAPKFSCRLTDSKAHAADITWYDETALADREGAAATPASNRGMPR